MSPFKNSRDSIHIYPKKPKQLVFGSPPGIPESIRKCQPSMITLNSQSAPVGLVPSSSALFSSLPFACLFACFYFSNALSNCFNSSLPRIGVFFPCLLVLESKPKASYTLSKISAGVLYPLRVLAVSLLCSPLLAWAHCIGQAGLELAVLCFHFSSAWITHRCLCTAMCADQLLMSTVDPTALIHWI